MTEPAPEVRVVVVNYNGGEMTLACLRAIQATDWPRDALETVLVDNGSSDGVLEAAERDLDIVTIRSDTNLGFAGGANLGLRDLPPATAYVAIVNNDVTVPATWLRPLATVLASDPTCGAACPKILLADRYEAVEVVGDPVRLSPLDRREVTVRISGVRVGGDDVLRRTRFGAGFLGPEFPPGDAVPFQWASARATVLLPVLPGAPARELRLSAPARRSVVLRTGAEERTVTVGPSPTWVELPAPAEPFDVINNVGSEVEPDGYARDRGYLERDVGQFDDAADVDAWCGAAVLLPASYLRTVGHFDDRLFAYYEDVELSLRGRPRWRYRTVPESVVRHVHMATSSASAPRALYFNERNRLLVLSRYAPRRTVVKAVARYVASTLSYLRRDVVSPLAHGRRPSWTVGLARMRALRDCLRAWCGAAPAGPWSPKWQ
ncbi:MAG TPA: glycosyltransferase [Acidimicrobiia bacterium]